MHDKPTVLGVARQQAITWANVDQAHCVHLALLGHNELIIGVGVWLRLL